MRAGAPLHCWGSNEWGELGTGDFELRASPAAVGPATGWQRVTVGWDHACAIRSGELYCWGDSENGVLGHDEGLVPVAVEP